MISKDKIFLKKHGMKVLGYPVCQLLDVKKATGDVGIEIEVEGNKFKKTELPSYWTYHKDGSLRGDDNAEYVLKKPIRFEQVEDAVSVLWAMFKEYGSVLDDSNRTSVHVHLNVQNFHMNRLCAFIALYMSVEDILTNWCGDHRVGNLFCLRTKDAPAIASSIKNFIRDDSRYKLKDGLHYAGLNVSSIYKFGSLEIRTLRGVTDPQVILDWVSILQRIYELSADYPDPRDVVEGFSGSGPFSYLEKVLGDKTSLVTSSCNMNHQDMMESLYEGIRYAQDLCYCRDWSIFEPASESSNPFNRVKMSTPVTGLGAYQALGAYQDIPVNPAEMWVTPVTQPISPAPSPSTFLMPEEEYEEFVQQMLEEEEEEEQEHEEGEDEFDTEEGPF